MSGTGIHFVARPVVGAGVGAGADSRQLRLQNAIHDNQGMGVGDSITSVPAVQLCIQRAACSPTWLSVMMGLRQFHDSLELFLQCGSFTTLPSSALTLSRFPPWRLTLMVNNCAGSFVNVWSSRTSRTTAYSGFLRIHLRMLMANPLRRF